MLHTAFCLTFYHLQGLLRTTLPNPKAERCYAQYEITQLLPGIELFSDPYRANICSVVASLYFVIRELHFAKQNIIVSNWSKSTNLNLLWPYFMTIYLTLFKIC